MTQEPNVKALRIGIHGDLIEVDLPADGGTRFVAAVRELLGAQGIQVLGLTNCWDLWLDEDGITTGGRRSIRRETNGYS